MKYSNGTITQCYICISLSDLVSCAFSTIPICPFFRIFHSLVIIGIAMVFVFSPYIIVLTFNFKPIATTLNDFRAQNLYKLKCVSNMSLNYHYLSQLWLKTKFFSFVRFLLVSSSSSSLC